MGASASKTAGEVPMWRSLLMRALKAYGMFAVAHTLIKLVRFVLRQRRFEAAMKHVPGVRMGLSEMQSIMRSDIHRMQDLRNEWVAPFIADADMSILPGNDVACLSEDAVKWMLKDEFKRITKVKEENDYAMAMLADFVGEHGIFVLRHGDDPSVAREHEEWLFQRKTASTIFTKNQFGTFMNDVFTDKAERLLDVLGRVADAGDKTDMQRLFFAYTMDSIQKIFYSREVNTLEADAVDPYAQAFDTAHSNLVQFVMQNIFTIVALQEVAPWPLGAWNRDPRSSLGISLLRKLVPEGRIFEENIAFLHKETQKFVDQTRRDPNLASRQDLVAKFLNAPGGKDLTDEALRHMILNFILAGRDTTACTLTWMFFQLTQNPEVQRKLQAEIDEKLGGRNPTLEDLDPQNMPYLNGVLYETLRLHPPVPGDTKQTMEDVEFKGRIVPKDTVLVFFPFGMGRDPKRYPDPLKFDPERWIPFEQPSDFAFPVFQAGNRFCLGRHMAQFEAKLLASKLLQQFSFTLEPGEADKITYSLMITMSVKNGRGKDDNYLWLRPTRRT